MYEITDKMIDDFYGEYERPVRLGKFSIERLLNRLKDKNSKLESKEGENADL